MTIHEKFIADMEAARIDWEPYEGRFFWKGPAVRTSDDGRLDRPSRETVIRSTSVALQWD